MESAIPIIFQLAVLLFSVVIHEVSHGFAAQALGDSTARYAGRLTLNPIPHLDPLGSVVIPIATFVIPYLLGGTPAPIGWAKPVPYNPYNLRIRNRELGSAIVGAAGPLSNIAIAIAFGVLLRLLGVFVPDGASGTALQSAIATIVFINIWIAIFNLVPIPPLDGSKVLFFFLTPAWSRFRFFLEQYGFFILLLLIFSFDGFFRILFGLALTLFSLFTGARF